MLIQLYEPSAEQLDAQNEHYQKYNFRPNWFSFHKDELGYRVLLEEVQNGV